VSDLKPGISVSDKVRGLKWIKVGWSSHMCVCVCLYVCVGVGVRCLAILCISAYCLPCRHGDDIMAHDCRTMERIPPILFTEKERKKRWRDSRSDRGREKREERLSG